MKRTMTWQEFKDQNKTMGDIIINGFVYEKKGIGFVERGPATETEKQQLITIIK